MRSLARRALGTSAAAYAASLLPRRPRARFVVVCLPRSGSELLVDLLDQLPGLTCRGEIMRHQALRPIRYLEGRARLDGLRGAQAWGCKLLVQHLQWYESGYGPAVDVLGDLVARGWTVVHLRRGDVLASALSALHAEQSQRWHTRADDAGAGFEPVAADVATTLAWIHSYDTYQRWLDDVLARVPHQVVHYEENLRDAAAAQATVDRLARHLGVAPAPVQVRLRPVAPKDPFARVADPEALKQVLRLTRFAPLVDG